MNRAKEIARLHSEIECSLRLSLGKAIRIGQLLTEQKAELAHGEWDDWVRDHLSFSIATSRNYRRLYRERGQLKSLNVSGLSDAYRKLYGKRPRVKDKPKPEDDVDNKPDVTTFKLELTIEEDKKFRKLIEWLGVHVFETNTVKATVLAALEYAKGEHNG